MTGVRACDGDVVQSLFLLAPEGGRRNDLELYGRNANQLKCSNVAYLLVFRRSWFTQTACNLERQLTHAAFILFKKTIFDNHIFFIHLFYIYIFFIHLFSWVTYEVVFHSELLGRSTEKHPFR